MCWVMTVVHRWSVATCKLGYCPGDLLLFAQLLLVLWFCSANAVWIFFLFGSCWSARVITWYEVTLVKRQWLNSRAYSGPLRQHSCSYPHHNTKAFKANTTPNPGCFRKHHKWNTLGEEDIYSNASDMMWDVLWFGLWNSKLPTSLRWVHVVRIFSYYFLIMVFCSFLT